MEEKSSTPTGLVWNTNMAADSFLWSTNVVAVTSCENFIEDPTRLPCHHVQTSNCILPGFMKTGLGKILKF